MNTVPSAKADKDRRYGSPDAEHDDLGHVDYEPHRKRIDQLVDAIERRRVCEITYHSALRRTARRYAARPLRLVWHRSALFLLAALGDHRRIATLAIHRIHALAVTSKQFAQPRIDLDDHAAKAFGTLVGDKAMDVEVRFDAEIAWHVEERTFHPDERKDRLPDGTLRYRLRTRAQWQIIPWVASFGPLAELVTPTAWREVLRANVEATLRRYGPDRNAG